MKTNIIRLQTVDSTNRYLHDCPPVGEEEMTVAVADYQTAGRGQGTNTWESEAGTNLLFSLMVHPCWMPVGRQFLLSMAGALALKETLDAYIDFVTLKWPNDMYWRDSKLSGTLIETTVNSRGIGRCIFGIGLNVNQREFRSDAPNPVSLYQLLGREIDREHLLHEILHAFEHYYELLRQGRYGEVSQRYHEALYRRSGFYRYRDKDGEFEGAIVEVEDDGHLILRDREGSIRSYAFKEVEFVRS